MTQKGKCDVEHDRGQLVDRARRGDHDAWSVLYLEVYPRLVAFAQRRLGQIDSARDAVAETMTRGVAGIATYVGDDDGFAPWLFGICRHVIADAQRRGFREPAHRVLLHEADPSSPADALIDDDERVAVRMAFARLSDDERELLELRVIAGLSSAEVAGILGKQPGAVRMAQKRALARLRTFVEEMARV